VGAACVELFKTDPDLKGRVGHHRKRSAILGLLGNAVVSSWVERGEGMKCRAVGDRSQAGMSAMSDKGVLYFSIME
jgi:hypothetical protein